MRKKNRLPYLWICCLLLFLMSRPKTFRDYIQGTLVATFAPIWQWQTSPSSKNTETLQLQAENQLLKNEVERMQELLKESFYLKNEVQQLLSSSKNLMGARLKELNLLLKKRLETIPSRVIYRAAGSWNSSFWIDVGTNTNLLLNRQIVCKNSPVVVGDSLIGAIDYVGKNQSRVRLITDPELNPAVRSVRGRPQAMRLIETVNVLLDNLHQLDTLLIDVQDKENLYLYLQKLQKSLNEQKETLYLAKGELMGNCSPCYRSHGNLLRGTGFNYEFSDEKGPARDLRTGIPYEQGYTKEEGLSLLKVHDILVTSGMDGIFPEGLQVAEIVEVEPLEEGAYFYNLKAKPTASNLDSLSLVFVMAPQGYDPTDWGATSFE